MALVEQHQKNGEPEPISLLTMFTPSSLIITDTEIALRGRAVQLGSRFGRETSGVDAIKEIMGVLRQEGFEEVEFQRDHLQNISDELLLAMSLDQDIHNDLVLYHTLLWKTGGDGGLCREAHRILTWSPTYQLSSVHPRWQCQQRCHSLMITSCQKNT